MKFSETYVASRATGGRRATAFARPPTPAPQAEQHRTGTNIASLDAYSFGLDRPETSGI
jgi:hypothetical protein